MLPAFVRRQVNVMMGRSHTLITLPFLTTNKDQQIRLVTHAIVSGDCAVQTATVHKLLINTEPHKGE